MRAGQRNSRGRRARHRTSRPIHFREGHEVDDWSGGGGASGASGNFGGGLGSGGLSLGPSQGGSTSVTLEVGGDKVAVSAIQENNTLLVRATASAWRSILDVIEKLDVMPLQVHIESQVVEVTLSGELSYGVSWFLENAATENNLPDVTNGLDIPRKWSTLGASIGGNAGPGLAWTLIQNDAAAIINALDKVTDVRLLQTLANAMSVALENARLFDETQRLLKETEQRNAELAVINSIQQGIAGSLDFQGIVDLVGDKLLRSRAERAEQAVRRSPPRLLRRPAYPIAP